MKISLAIVFLVALSAGAYALDLAGFFAGFSPAAPAPAAAAPAVPAPSAGSAQEETDFPMNMKPEQARRFIESEKPSVIDIRTAEEYAAGRLQEAGAPLDYYAPDFKERLGKLDKNAPYLIYCRSGRRSAAALQLMKDLGFQSAHHLEGGILAWMAAGLPVVK